ncbi:MAG: hypothetical protein KQI35_08110 [Bacteroidetes bacterium]|nr:hypothetical protein [Bacteroidota bacterium]
MLSKIFQTINILSLDVVVGAFLGAHFASKIFEAAPGIAFWIILPVSVWVVYTADHLVDAYRLKSKAHTPRHLFHHHHFKILGLMVISLSVINVLLAIFFLDHRIVIFGFVVGGFTLLYLFTVHFLGGRKKFYLQKEFFVAIIYVSGVWGGPWALSDFPVERYSLILFFIFFLLAIADVLIFTVYEFSTDRLDNHPTLFSHVGQKTIMVLFFCATAMATIGSIFIIVESPFFIDRAAAKIYLIMLFVLLLLVSMPDLFKSHDQYRYFAEMVFWLPAILLLI